MEEKSDNQKTNIEKYTDEFYGLEYEEFSEDNIRGIKQPFDADKIRIDQQMLSLKYIYDLMKENHIELNPDFQRNRVWTERKRKSLLIESLMLRIPIPAFYFYENENSKFIVIDGQQRLSTIQEFIDDKFKLFGLEYLENECGSKYFSQLDIKYQQRINRTQIAVNILDARSPSNVMFDIFRRVNTGGVSLKPQEIRNAIAKNSTRNFLKSIVNSIEFQEATRGRIKDERMDAQEMIVRFIAFYKAYDFKKNTINYNTGDLAVFLDDALLSLNKESSLELERYASIFKKAMRISTILFKEYSFRKCYLGKGDVYSNIDIINKSLFTSWSVILSNPEYSECDFNLIGNKVLNKLAYSLTHDYTYNTCLTQGTNSTRSIHYSFKMANDIMMEALIDD